MRLFSFPVHAKKWFISDLLGGAAGIAGGLGTVAFRLMIRFNNHLFFNCLA